MLPVSSYTGHEPKFEKSYLSYLNPAPYVGQNRKFHVKQKQFGTKIVLSGYFWAVVLNKGCHI